MVNISFCLCLSYGMPTSIREVLWSLDGGMRHFLDLAQYALKVLVGVPSSCPRPLVEFPLCVECILNELININTWIKKLCKLNKHLSKVVKGCLVKVWRGIGMVTSYLTYMILKNDSS